MSIAYGPRGESIVWLIGAVVCLHSEPPVQLFAGAGNGWRGGIISSCQSAATSETPRVQSLQPVAATATPRIQVLASLQLTVAATVLPFIRTARNSRQTVKHTQRSLRVVMQPLRSPHYASCPSLSLRLSVLRGGLQSRYKRA